jgi:hypothetical protein
MLVVAAIVLDVGALLFFVATRRDPSNTPGIVAVMVAAIVTVGALVLLIQRTTGRELAVVVSETNAALRSLADQAGLDLVEPQAGSDASRRTPVFVEARGVCFGVHIRASVEPIATDELTIALRFQGRVIDAASIEELRRSVDGLAVDGQGLTLYLGRKTRFWKPFLLTYDRLPETDGSRLWKILQSGCALLRAAAVPGSPNQRDPK